MNHSEPYPDNYIADILSQVKTIALIGASPKPTRASNDVLRYMHEQGYIMKPVNPREAGNTIHGLLVYESLEAIEEPVDMVQVFRASKHLLPITHDAISIGAKVVWAQLGVFDEQAAVVAEAAGLQMVMNRCPKIELHASSSLGT
jgi:predicted CoA-binding protein